MKKLYLLLLNINLVKPCGMSTHIEINNRAINWLKYTDTSQTNKILNILQTNPGSWQAGSFFPDWGFGCNNYHDESEEAHWPIFHGKLVELIRTEYADSLYELQTSSAVEIANTKGKDEFFKVLGFLFGLVGHSVADVLFHDLDHREQGLIRAFANLNFHGDYYKTHQVADFGGELILSHRYNLDYYSSFWYTPTSNIIKVYRRMGYNKINSIVLNSCMSLGYIAAQSNAKQGRLAFGKFELNKSPAMIQEFEDYFKGGVNSMSFKVYECWLELINVLMNDLKFENFCLKIFPDYAKIKTNVIRANKSSIDWNNLSASYSGDNNDIDVNTKSCTKLDESKGLLRIRSIRGKKDYERFGTSLAAGDFNGDGLKDLVIASPYHFNHRVLHSNEYSVGTIRIYSGGKSILKLHQLPKVILKSPDSFSSNSGFGKSLTVLDANGDGIDDLVVGTPHFESSGKLTEEYAGSIFIYSGNSNWNSISENFRVLPLPNTIKQHNYTQFGTKLFSIDINEDGLKDLIVGLPFSTNIKGNHLQSGQFCVYLNTPKGISNQPEWCLSSPHSKPYERFGFHISQKILFDNRTSLLVGAPSYQNENKTLLGRIYEIELDIDGFPTSNQKVLIEGFEERMQIGRSFDVDSNFPSKFMLISASSEDSSTPLITHWQAGKVYKFDFVLSQLELSAKAFENGGQFGTEIKYHPQSGWWSTEPGRDGEKGGVHRINPDASDGSVCMEPTTQLGRFGSSILLEDLDGDGDPDLVIGEPYHSGYLDKSSPSGLRSEGRIQILFSIPEKLPLSFIDKYFYFKDFYYNGVSVTLWSFCLIVGLLISVYKLKSPHNRVREHNN